MQDKDFKQLWFAYRIALSIEDYEQADLVLRTAVGYCYTRGLTSKPAGSTSGYNVTPFPPTVTPLDLLMREQCLVDMLRILQQQASPPDFQYRCFRDTLKRIYSEGMKGTPVKRGSSRLTQLS